MKKRKISEDFISSVAEFINKLPQKIDGLLNSEQTDYLSKFMNWFYKKKMNEQDFNNEEEIIEEGENPENIPVNDKRRFNAEGERMNFDEERDSKIPFKSAKEIELENKLIEETTRRESAEAKLIGVQAKFEEVKAEIERETQEMRGRMQKKFGRPRKTRSV